MSAALHRAPSRPSGSEALDIAFKARTVAVLGASSNPGKLGNIVVRTMVDRGFGGRVIPINRSGADIAGQSSFKHLHDVPGPVDVAVIMVPADQMLASLNECAAKGVKVVAAMTSGFSEAGQAGERLQSELEQMLATAPYRLLGPNCEGYVFPAQSSFVTFSAMVTGAKPGSIGIVAQSGAISGAIVNRLGRMGVGIRALVTTGNECDITATDALEWFAADDATTTIVCYLEQIRDAARFVAIARSLRGRKAIVIQKPGRGTAAREAVSTHTGAIAGDDRVAEGVFEELQIIRAYDHTEAVDAAAGLGLGRRLRGLRLGIVSIAGGLAVEACDLCEAAGFAIPRFDPAVQARIGRSLPYFAAVRNPVDLTGAALSDPGMFRDVIGHVLDHGEIDALIVVVTFSHQVGFAEVLLDAAKSSSLPVVIVWTAPEQLTPEPLRAFRDTGFPVFDSPLRAVTALRAIARFSGML